VALDPTGTVFMNKNDLVDSLAEEFELTKSYARDLVDSMFQRIIDAAIQGDEIDTR
jgi:DNA-binding protein HU-beta